MLTNATNVRYQQETAASLIGQTHDTRRWRSEPDLGTSIKFLDRITSYLDRVGICMRKTKVGRRTVVRRPSAFPSARRHDRLSGLRMVAPPRVRDAEVDVMLKSKGRDVALLELPTQLRNRGVLTSGRFLRNGWGRGGGTWRNTWSLFRRLEPEVQKRRNERCERTCERSAHHV